MDVTCNRCNTEYEFEEALVSSRGTTVKCTHCGNLFKVQRSARVLLPSDAKHWTVRQTDGRAHVLEDLSALPGMIAEGKLGREDELSRTGKLWRRLGDIEELDEHFAQADRRGPSRVLAQPLPVREMPRVSPTPPAAEPVSRRPGPLKLDQAAEASRDRGVRHESWLRAWARLLTSAAIVGALALWFFSLPPSEHFSRAQTETPSDPSARFLDAAERALSAYRVDQFEEALVEYIKALAFHEHDVHILSAVSHVHALWAEELRSQRELSKPAPGQAAGASLETLALDAQAHALQAKRYAELAWQGNPGNPQAQLATSDALRLAGDLEGARTALSQAEGSAEALRISALLKLQEADPQAAVELAAQAVAVDPKLLAARFLLARLLLAQGDAEATHAQLEALKAQDSQHPEALRLEALLLARQAPAAQALAESPKPSEADSFIERGRSALEAGQTAAAKRLYEHALSLQPDSVPAHAGLGQVALARGRPVQAMDHLVAAALGGDGDSLISLADMYRRLGRQHEALTAYQSYLQQNPNGPQLDLAKTQIERLGEQFASAGKP